MCLPYYKDYTMAISTSKFLPNLNTGIIRKDIIHPEIEYVGIFNIDDEIFDAIAEDDDTGSGNKNLRLYTRVEFEEDLNVLNTLQPTLSGKLLVNKPKVSDRSPDFNGAISAIESGGNVEYNIAGWIKRGKMSPFLSCAISKMEKF